MTEQQLYKKLYRQAVNSAHIPFIMSNSPLALQICEDAKAKYPDAKVFSYGTQDYICLTDLARKYLLQYQQKHKQDLEKHLEETESLIMRLQKEMQL